MTRNIYWHADPCPTCEHAERLHIGHFAHGWPFHFKALRGLAGAENWRQLFKTGGIVDQYGGAYTPEEFWLEVERFQEAIGKSYVTEAIQKYGWKLVDGYLFIFE